MATITRGRAIGLIKDTLEAYRIKVEEASRDGGDRLVEEGKLILNSYRNRNMDSLLGPIRNNCNFFDEIGNSQILQTVHLCQKIANPLELNMSKSPTNK